MQPHIEDLVIDPAVPGSERILIVDDEPYIVDLLQTWLEFTGFVVRVARTGAEALAVAEQFRPHLLLMDVMLPDVDGFELCRQLRHAGQQTAVVFLTARNRSEDAITGLTVGGDDYINKPFSLDEVVARIRAVLRRTSVAGVVVRAEQAADAGVLRFLDLELDEVRHEVRRATADIELSPTEFALLRYLLLNSGRVLSKQQIVAHVWNYDFQGDPRIVESYISSLRRKVDRVEPALIHTVRGVGYTLRLGKTALPSQGSR
jgi:two-component system OmpR family response regulator